MEVIEFGFLDIHIFCELEQFKDESSDCFDPKTMEVETCGREKKHYLGLF